MARIVYSFSGEGRGHASRAETVVSMLAEQHDVLVYAPPIAIDRLRHVWNDWVNVSVKPLDCLRFGYRANRLSYSLSLIHSVPFFCRMRGRVAELAREVSEWGASHIINDFEPLLARVAPSVGLPLISLDHQHFLTAIDTRCLVPSLAWKVRLLRPSVNWFCPNPVLQIVSSYFDYPVRQSTSGIRKVGVLLRRSVRLASPRSDSHVLVYMRRELSQPLRRSLFQVGRPVNIFGLGSRAKDRNLEFHASSTDLFLEHLRTCAAVVCGSGNQLIGEALYLRKPILAIPEKGNFEQEINGYFLADTGGGITLSDDRIEPNTVAQFVERRSDYQTALGRFSGGNEATIKYLSQWIAAAVDGPAARPSARGSAIDSAA